MFGSCDLVEKWESYNYFKVCPVFGEPVTFQTIFRPNHGDSAVKKGTNLFVSFQAMIFVFESLNFIEYWQSYGCLKVA